MSRSGYTDDYDYDQWAHIRWRGAVASAFRGKKGQAFFKELLASLDAMPEKRLIRNELVCKDGMCTLGALAVHRGLDTRDIDPEDYDRVAQALNVNEKIVQEIVWHNDESFVFMRDENGKMLLDESGKWIPSTPEYLWIKMRAWVAGQIKS